MTRNYTIAIDIDGVIYDIIAHITDEYLPPKFRGYRPENWNCWEEFGITKEEFFKLYSKAWEKISYDFIFAAKYTDPYAHKLFDTIHKDGYRISIITKRGKHNIINTLEYLHEFKFHYDTFTTITDSQDKTLEHFDVIIDDNPENMPIYGYQLGLLINQRWNENYECNNENIFRINNLEEAIPLIHHLYPPALILHQS